ncbi:MAG: DUF5702 domain-containing protein [Clostridiales Family XIII bacterium]|jgi:hypothetical protein|nr:DUF5702 domain-containing protein [Clostridiales Family XIII bacterium]
MNIILQVRRRIRALAARIDRQHNIKGSAAVWICIVLSGVVTISSVLYYASKESARRSTTDAYLSLATRSVLSTYDTELLARYGLKAFKADDKSIEDKLRYYAGASIENPSIKYITTSHQRTADINSNRVQIHALTADTKGYAITDIATFSSQIQEAMLGSFLASRVGSNKKIVGQVSSAVSKSEPNRVLRNPSVLSSLPGKDLTDTCFPNLGSVPIHEFELSDFGKAKDMLLLDEYILNMFKYAVGGQTEQESFFENEVEYIIRGSKDDKANYTAISRDIYAYRLLMNNTHIVLDKEKMKMIKTWCSVHPYVAIATVIIVEIWAIAETRNDILLLEKGEKVPFLKSSKNWALDDLEAILDVFTADDVDEAGNIKDGYEKAYDNHAVMPDVVSGLNYKDHLRVILGVMDANEKFLRMMDLIQINMKGTYNKDFMLREYKTGLNMKATVGSMDYEYTSTY